MSEALFRFASLFILLCHVCSSILGPSPFLKAAVTKNDVKFDPYVDNGGTAVGIAGKDYVIVATDTRLSDKYSIKSRKLSKVFEVGRSLLVGSGCWADSFALYKDISMMCSSHKLKFGMDLPPKSFSSLLSNMLYKRRLTGLLYYSFCITGGLDEQGHGCLWKFDCAGSYQPVVATCTGRGESMIQPMLDQITALEEDEQLWEFCENVKQKERGIKCVDLSMERACDFVIRAFKAAAEREITIGDGIELVILHHNNNNSSNSTDNNTLPASYTIERLFVPLPFH